MVNMNGAIQYMERLIGKVTYSMYGSRTGTDGTADCSGMVYKAMIENGATKETYPVSTETQHAWLLKNGFKLIAFNKEWKMQRGDVVILGIKGQSAFAGGHTFIAYDNVNAIDCSWDRNGIAIRNEREMPYNLGWYVYRLENGTTGTPAPQSPPSPIKWYDEKGSFKLNTDIYLRKKPNTTSEKIALLKKGQVIKYDKFAHINGLIWIRQPRKNGYGYMATGQSVNGKRQNYWGAFY